MAHHTVRHPVHRKKSHRQTETFDYIVRFFVVATPLFELPQAWQIYATQSARDVSLPTWIFFCIADVVWIVYACKLKSVPLQVTYSLYLAIEISIVVGILLYS
ncbi:MAG TPA: PQ-loop domain-containing transporter [Candidatus Saccharimonadales bacterium]|nr:PQ-loop domain-containing transporter [Candidatus Saccharimonadales bacterium]